MKNRQITLFLLFFSALIFKNLTNILFPLISATFITLLCLPLALRLEKKFKLNPQISAFLCLTPLFCIVALIVLFISGQINIIGKNLPSIVHNIREQFISVSVYAKTNFDLDESKIKLITSGLRQELLKKGNFLITSAVMQISEMMMNLLLIPVYVFLMLVYRVEIKRFLISFFGAERSGKTLRILKKARKIAPRYLIGLFLEMITVTLMSVIGFLVCGVPFPFFLGLIAGLLNMIPYVGNLIAGTIAILTALAFSNNLMIVLAAFFISAGVQLIDNNFVLPKLVASRVNINPLVAIIVIIIGGTVSGIGGMFLALPITAMIKIICDESKEWRPIGLFIGNHFDKK